MTTHVRFLDARDILATTIRALAASAEGIDSSAVRGDTPLAALMFDSLNALKFIATLETYLGVRDLPFEQWLAEHSERVDALTVASLVEWLESLPDVRARQAAPGRSEPEA